MPRKGIDAGVGPLMARLVRAGAQGDAAHAEVERASALRDARAWARVDVDHAQVERATGPYRLAHKRNPSLRLRRICLLAPKGLVGVQCKTITGVYCKLQLLLPGILLSMLNQLGITSLPGSYTRRKGRRTSCKEDCT